MWGLQRKHRQSPVGTLTILFDFLQHAYFYLKLCYSFAYLFIVIYLPNFYSELHKENRSLFHYKLPNV